MPHLRPFAAVLAAIRSIIASIDGVPSVFGGKIVMGKDHYSTSSGMGIWLVKAGKLIKAPPPKP